MSKRHRLGNHQSSHARPDELMSPEARDATSPQRRHLKQIAATKRRQRDAGWPEFLQGLTDEDLAAYAASRCDSPDHNDGCTNPDCPVWGNSPVPASDGPTSDSAP